MKVTVKKISRQQKLSLRVASFIITLNDVTFYHTSGVYIRPLFFYMTHDFKTVDGYLEIKCPMRDFAILDSWTLSHKLKAELHTAMRSLIIHTLHNLETNHYLLIQRKYVNYVTQSIWFNVI